MSGDQSGRITVETPTGPALNGKATYRGGTPRVPTPELLLGRDDLARLPKPTPLIENTIDRHSVSLLVGDRGTCKSFTALDLGGCIATGRMWQRRQVEQGRVLYVAAEGAYGLDDRLSAWEYGWRRTILSDRFRVWRWPVNLLDAEAVAGLRRLAEGMDFVVVDTLARCIPGADENSARDMGLAVDALYRLRNATGRGSVLGVHHTGKDRTTTRGSSALEDGVDTVYRAEGDARNMRLIRTKRRDGPTDDALQLSLKPVLNSGVLVHPVADMPPRADALLSVFMSAFLETGASKSDLRTASDMPSATFHRSLNTLVKTGILVNAGTEARPFYRLQQE